MTFSIREAATSVADLAAIAAIVNLVTPDDPTSIEEMRWADATYPGGTRILAEIDGRPVAVGTVGRIYMYPPDFDGFWATLAVLPEARRQGVGSTLLAAVSDRARTAGKTALHVPASDARPDGIDFLVHRRFAEYERTKAVELSLAGHAPPPVDPPAGIRITTLAERPDLVPGVHAVALEAFADIPSGTEPIAAGELAEFRARDVDRPAIPPDAFMVATEAATDQVVGYASLLLVPGAVRRVAWHDMTAVLRAWRGRGIAAALKRATIAWAVEAGLERLETGNDTDNAPMRAVNGRLGYRPLPDLVVLRGPLFDGMMARP
jgi:GNAT superfamily N-acetyltransferase